MATDIKVDQAIYGAVKNGHALRSASGDRKLAAELAHRLDLPDTAPPGAEWSPFVSGFAIRDRYVLARTFSDTTASRAGMVLTHALIGSLQEIVHLDHLGPLFDRISPDLAGVPAVATQLSIDIESAPPPSSPDLGSAARLLVTRGAGPVVRVGVSGFEQLVASLWAQLWPSIRRNFSFRLSFGPNDVVEQPAPTIVCTPPSLIGRWHQHRIVGQGGSEGIGAAAMIDGSEAGIVLRHFASSIGAELSSFDVLRLLEQAHKLATVRPNAIASLLAAVRLVESLSHDPVSGQDEKRSIIGRLVTAIADAQPADVLTLRNLALDGFATGREVWHALECWFEKASYPAVSDGDMTQIVADALVPSDARPEWRDAARQGLERAVRAAKSEFPPAFWRWIERDSRIGAPLIKLIGRDSAVIDRLVATAPEELSPAATNPIIASATSLKLFSLHAVVASASMSPLEAAKAQSAIEPGDDPSSMRLAVRHAKPSDLLDIAAAVTDARVLRLASDSVAKTPTLLAKRNMADAVNRLVWRDALKVNPQSWRGPSNPRAEFEELLGQLIDGNTADAALVAELSSSPLADVSNFNRRRELWRHLENGVRERLLAATADTWFSNPDPDIEPELVDRVRKDRRLDALITQVIRTDFASGLRLLDGLTVGDQPGFRRWIEEAVRPRNLSPGDADLLGRSVAARGRSSTLDDLVALRFSGRRDLDPALRHCTSLIGFWDKIWLGISPVTDADKRESLAQVAAELYPSGPDDNSLWERAGGKDSDLAHNGSGLSRWRDALRAISNGKKPPIANLIREMRSDFAANPKLRVMAEDPLFRR